MDDIANVPDDLDDLDALLDAPINKKESKESSRDKSRSRSPSSKRSRKDDDRRRSKSRDRRRDHHQRSPRNRSKSPSERRAGERRRSRDRSRRSRERRRSRSPRESSRRSSRRSRSRSPRDRHRRSSRDRHRSSKSRDRHTRHRSKSRSPSSKAAAAAKSPEKEKSPEMSVEERDARTVFIMQLSQRVRAHDIEEFFSSIGKIKDIKLIICNRTRRFKGIAYVEFVEIESVPLAMGLNGQKLLGVPVIVQPSQAEKNRLASTNVAANAVNTFPNKPKEGPARLYVGSLHYNITEDMVRGIFEPFGKIALVQMTMDVVTQKSKGYCFITYENYQDCEKAVAQMDGFELAGRPMKVTLVVDKTSATGIVNPLPPSVFNNKDALQQIQQQKAAAAAAAAFEYEHQSQGLHTQPWGEFGASGRLALMAKLAEGTDLQVPTIGASGAVMSGVPPPPSSTTTNGHSVVGGGQAAPVPENTIDSKQQQSEALAATNPPVATPAFMLSNMFDPTKTTKTGAEWETELNDIKNDIIEECNKFGGVCHAYIDKKSEKGLVYVKCPTVQTALSSVNALHGRWFDGKVITAAYIPLINYHNLFPDSITLTQPIKSTR